MKIVVIGSGYVGLVSGACFAELGHEVVCVDKDGVKIDLLKTGVMPIYEPGLEAIVKHNYNLGNISFTTDLKEALEGAKCVFLAVGTPTNEKDGSADLTYVFEAAKEIAHTVEGRIVVVTKSTVPVGTGHLLLDHLRKQNRHNRYMVVSNPEFLREGMAVHDFMNPDRIVVGTEEREARLVMQEIYQGLVDNGAHMHFTSVPSAEIIKYASNAFLATKIAFVNEMADLCEKSGGNIKDVTIGMGLDKRIGMQYLVPGPGYGGSCFPKDTRALVKTAEDYGTKALVVEATVKANSVRRLNMAKKIIEACGGVAGKEIAILGLTFKANTDDMRESPAVVIIKELAKKGAYLKLYDPKGMEEAKKMFFEQLYWFENSGQALSGSDAAVILTEWDEFRKIDFKKSKMNGKTIIDLRNILDEDKLVSDGFDYYSVGRNRELIFG